ncbi:MAG: hypothetical protein K5Q00_07595 [Gammaproteobacteria bacterium]|nr:hypothetical protein [Gammaproteobacteria bacterium]
MDNRPLDTSRVSLIELFTQENELVYDPNVQHGDTLAASLYAGREFIGIADTEQQAFDAVKYIDIQLWGKPYQLFNRERNSNVLNLVDSELVDFILTEVPLFDFNSSAENYQRHIASIIDSIENAVKKLKSTKHIALIIADQRYKDRFYCRHADVLNALQGTNLTLQGVINVIRDSQALKAFGYPSTYVPNVINHFVIIFRKK